MLTSYIDEQSVEAAAQATWSGSPAVRAEFGELSTYLAFMKAEARGAVKIVRTLEMKARSVLGGSAQRPMHREDRQEIKKWAEQTVRRIRAEHGAPLTDVKPHKVQTLDEPRQFSDGDLLGMIRSEKEAAEYWDISPALQDEFPSSASLWHFVKAKREGRVKFLQQGGLERPRATGANPHTVLTFSGPGPSSGSKLFKAVTCEEDA